MIEYNLIRVDGSQIHTIPDLIRELINREAKPALEAKKALAKTMGVGLATLYKWEKGIHVPLLKQQEKLVTLYYTL